MIPLLLLLSDSRSISLHVFPSVTASAAPRGWFREWRLCAGGDAAAASVMPLCWRCELVVVEPYELYCGRQCAGAAAGDARWHSLAATTHALHRGEHALLHFPGQDGGPRGDNYFECVIRDF